VQEQGGVRRTMAPHDVPQYGLFAVPRIGEYHVEVGQIVPELGVGRLAQRESAETIIPRPGPPDVSRWNEAAGGKPRVRSVSLGKRSGHLDQFRVDLYAVGFESEEVRHDGDDAGRRAHLEESSARVAESQQVTQDTLVIGRDERMPGSAPYLFVEPFPDRPALIAQRADSLLVVPARVVDGYGDTVIVKSAAPAQVNMSARARITLRGAPGPTRKSWRQAGVMTIAEHSPNDFMIRFYDGSTGLATEPPRASAPTATSVRLIRCPDPDEV